MRIRAAWAGLVICSGALSWLFVTLAVPAAVLVGPMLVAIGFGVAGAPVRVPRPVFVFAQGVVGCLIASSVTAEVLREVVRDWPAMLFGLTSTVVLSALVGWAVARFGSLPGTTAAWGSSPGAASAMTAMAEDFGADPRLVAAMQYVRVIVVVLTASFVSKIIAGEAPHAVAPQAAAAPALDPAGLAATLVVAFVGSWLGRRLRIPAGGILVPLALGVAINGAGPIHLATPTWLLALVYGVIGWTIGLQFERATLSRSARALPEIAVSALAIVGLCGLTAFLMVRFLAIDPLTAFLATSPGGIDTVAIIALSGGADTPFVMALQTLRVLVVVATGPQLAQFIARTAIRGRESRP